MICGLSLFDDRMYTYRFFFFGVFLLCSGIFRIGGINWWRAGRFLGYRIDLVVFFWKVGILNLFVIGGVGVI